jgi:hypothetical protein
MDRIIKNYEEPLFKPMSTKQYFNFLKHRRSVKKQNKQHKGHSHQNEHNHDHGQGNISGHSHENLQPKNISVVSLALVVDGIVAEVMNVQSAFAEILQKNPTFVLLNEDDHRPHIGWVYQNETFVPYDEIIKKTSPTMRG